MNFEYEKLDSSRSFHGVNSSLERIWRVPSVCPGRMNVDVDWNRSGQPPAPVGVRKYNRLSRGVRTRRNAEYCFGRTRRRRSSTNANGHGEFGFVLQRLAYAFVKCSSKDGRNRVDPANRFIPFGNGLARFDRFRIGSVSSANRDICEHLLTRLEDRLYSKLKADGTRIKYVLFHVALKGPWRSFVRHTCTLDVKKKM